MNYQHKNLAAGSWKKLSFVEQMANIGSDVERAISWQEKDNAAYSRQAFERALELMDLTLEGAKSYARLKEIARAREVMVDYFFGGNLHKSSALSCKKYFSQFAYAARKNR